MHSEGSQLSGALLGKCVERCAANDRAVVLRDDEALDLHFEPFARAAHEHAVCLQRLDDRQDPADVVDRRAAQMRERRGGDHRAHAVASEQLEQQGAVAMAADEVRPLDTVVAGAERARQVDQHVRRKLGVAGEQRLGLACRQLRQKLPAAVAHAFGLHQKNELVRRKPHRDLRGHLFERQIEDFAGRRVAERGHEHEVAIVEAQAHALDIDAAHFAGEAHVDAVDDADRLGGDEVAAHDANARTRHRRVGDTQREQRLDAAARVSHAFEDAVHRLRVGDAQAPVIAAGDILLLQYRLDLRPRAMDDDQPRPQAVQQIEVVDDTEKGFVGDDLAAETDDERLAAQGVDVRRSGADPWYEQFRVESHRRALAHCLPFVPRSSGR